MKKLLTYQQFKLINSLWRIKEIISKRINNLDPFINHHSKKNFQNQSNNKLMRRMIMIKMI